MKPQSVICGKTKLRLKFSKARQERLEDKTRQDNDRLLQTSKNTFKHLKTIEDTCRQFKIRKLFNRTTETTCTKMDERKIM